MRMIVLEGMLGEPMPHLLRSDWMMTCVMFLCMLLVSYSLSNGKKFLRQQMSSFFSNRERNSLFDEVTGSDLKYSFLLIFHTCIMLAFCVYYYIVHTSPLLFEKVSHVLFLAGLVFCVAFYLILKWGLYNIINWVFFQKVRNILWIKSFFYLVVWLGLLLLPVVLLFVYFDLSSQTAFYLVALIIIFAKIALFWKCFHNFFGKIHGLFHLILYFCALEILPDLILWKGIEMVNNNLTLNL